MLHVALNYVRWCFLHNIYIFYFLDQAQSNIDIVDRKAANQTSASGLPKIPAKVIHGYDVREEDIDTIEPGELINGTILSVMLR